MIQKLKDTYKYFFPVETIFLYSFGGSGTRMFYEWIKQYSRINGQNNVHFDQIRIKPKNHKVIYLYGNPQSAVRSFYRREYEDHQFIKRHCRNLGVPEVKEKTLEEYIDTGTDSFYLRSHLHRFVLSSNYKYDLLFVKFDSLWENLEEVLTYIGLEQHISSFPSKKQRRGSEIELSQERLEKFHFIYKMMEGEVDILPPVGIFNKGRLVNS